MRETVSACALKHLYNVAFQKSNLSFERRDIFFFNMKVMGFNSAFHLAVVLCFALIQTLAQDNCSSKSTCKECISLMGCQWCAAEVMWANSTAPARCRRRDAAAGSAAWCPPGDLVDPPDRLVTSKRKNLAGASDYLSPTRVHIQSRKGTVLVNFQVKKGTEQEFKEDDLQLNEEGTENAVPLLGIGMEVIFENNGWTVYSVNVTFEVACPESGDDVPESKLQLTMRDSGHYVEIELAPTCDCNCGKKREEHSQSCSGHGALHCGGCECGEEWSGATCDKWNCQQRSGRGDQSVSSCRAPADESSQDCSGDGTCECDRCVCRRPRRVYFDDYCTEFCTATHSCALCYFRHRNSSDLYYSESPSGDSPPGFSHRCQDECGITRLDSELAEGNECSVLDEDGCVVTYVGERRGDSPLLRLHGKNCSEEAGAIVVGGGATSIGVAGAVLGALAAAGLVAWVGVTLWKAAHAPSAGLAGAYEHMDPEANQGENPLYKSPTSIYTNPGYQPTKK